MNVMTYLKNCHAFLDVHALFRYFIYVYDSFIFQSVLALLNYTYSMVEGVVYRVYEFSIYTLQINILN